MEFNEMFLWNGNEEEHFMNGMEEYPATAQLNCLYSGLWPEALLQRLNSFRKFNNFICSIHHPRFNQSHTTLSPQKRAKKRINTFDELLKWRLIDCSELIKGWMEEEMSLNE